MICDYQMFWHEHRQRPRLVTNVTLGKGYTETLGDDGEIVKQPYDLGKVMRDARADAHDEMKQNNASVLARMLERCE